mgnify:CR=1 FL=1
MKAEIVDLDEIEEIIVAYANGDFSRRLSLSQSLNERDIIVSGINMLGEELQKRTVSRNFFSGIFNSIPEILIVLNRQGVIENINKNGTDTISLGVEEEVLGKNIREVLPSHIFTRFLDFVKSDLHSITFDNEMKVNELLSFPALCSLSKIHDSNEEQYLFIAQDVTEKKREELRILKATINGQEIERKRLANDLHDSLGQELNAVKMYVNAIEKMDSSTDLYKRSIKDVHGLLDLTIESIREISFGLMPSVLQTESLNTSIVQLINRMNSVQTIPIYHNFSGEQFVFGDKNDELFIYRIVQEFLNNSVKYSKANKIKVEVDNQLEEGVLEIKLSDDGVGFDFNTVKTNNGLSSIIYRLQALGSEFDFDSQEKRGTTLLIKINK